MKKVLLKALKAKIKEVSKNGDESDVIALLVELQDASGLKVCQNVSEKDVAYKEVI